MALPKLKAPAGDGELLAVPPLKEWPGLVERNRELFQTLSQTLPELACRRTFAKLGVNPDPPIDPLLSPNEILYTSESADGCTGAIERAMPWIVSGHQPEFFHPGVWIKNFANHRLAAYLGGKSWNLVVDSDLVKSSAIRVPNSSNGTVDTIPFDVPLPSMPFEERFVHDETLAKSLWRCALEFNPHLRTKTPFGTITTKWTFTKLHTRVRQAYEEDLGIELENRELSSLCASEAFEAFGILLLRRLPRFHQVHNLALQAYRRKHRLRSHNHPVPALEERDGWLEAPLWVWRSGETLRRRLFVRLESGELRLAAVGDAMTELPKSLSTSEPELSNLDPMRRRPTAWAQLHALGWKLRSRALLTTMYTRLCLSDLFIHGLGGGLYDEMTDEIIRGFFGIEPPAYAILTGTLRLPDPTPPAYAGGSSTAIRRALRDAHYNPDRHLPAGASAITLGLVREKAATIGMVPPTKPDRLIRFNRLHELNEQLRPKTAAERERLEGQLQEALVAEARARVFHDREYAFILHSKANMQRLIDQLAFD